MIKDEQGSLNRGLARTMEKANDSLVEQEQKLAKEKFKGFLEDLNEAMMVLNNQMKTRIPAARGK
jgi:hypothetical protein